MRTTSKKQKRARRQTTPTLNLTLTLTDVEMGPRWPRNGYKLGFASFVALSCQCHELSSFFVYNLENVYYYYFICPPTIAGDSQIFYSTSQFTMLMLLIYTYTPCVDYSPYCTNQMCPPMLSCVWPPHVYPMLRCTLESKVRSKPSFVLRYFSSSKNPSPSCSWKYLSYPNVTLLGIYQSSEVYTTVVMSAHDYIFMSCHRSWPSPDHVVEDGDN